MAAFKIAARQLLRPQIDA